ncbi:unnamed protein product [Lepeophtheirus salmonis]|uniref:(salmon louse) hypothetical protein n=1 Tax=Lepeophtheirus salmonis TaxID=72036 RepID=A0A7R8HBC1_LEPSM|nr:unnamed protein product [Lepeophtheirus salmonis]CAF2971243.1 unnamed protein product [Lepeophtheirus salmonis]
MILLPSGETDMMLSPVAKLNILGCVLSGADVHNKVKPGHIKLVKEAYQEFLDLEYAEEAPSNERITKHPSYVLTSRPVFRLDKDYTTCRIVLIASLADVKDKTKSLDKLLIPVVETEEGKKLTQLVYSKSSTKPKTLREKSKLEDMLTIARAVAVGRYMNELTERIEFWKNNTWFLLECRDKWSKQPRPTEVSDNKSKTNKSDPDAEEYSTGFTEELSKKDCANSESLEGQEGEGTAQVIIKSSVKENSEEFSSVNSRQKRTDKFKSCWTPQQWLYVPKARSLTTF